MLDTRRVNKRRANFDRAIIHYNSVSRNVIRYLAIWLTNYISFISF